MVADERFIAVLVTPDAAIVRFVAAAFDEGTAPVELHVLSSLVPLERYVQFAPVRVVLLHGTHTLHDPFAVFASYQQAFERTGRAPLPSVLLAREWPVLERMKALRAGVEDTIDTTPLGRRALPYIVSRAALGAGNYSRRVQELARLQSLGELATGVAHDFNNFLSAIIGRVGVLKRTEQQPQTQRSLGIIERAALDAAELVRRIRRFSRGESAPPHSHVDLHQLMYESVELLESRIDADGQRGVKHEVVLTSVVDADVIGNPTEIKEVIVNLLQNALDAMPAGGTVSLELSVDHESAEVRVRDSGVGMSDDVRAQALDPFYTTKGEYGSGLGLSISADIMRRHQGTLAIHSQQNAGTVVSLRFPLKASGTAVNRSRDEE